MERILILCLSALAVAFLIFGSLRLCLRRPGRETRDGADGLPMQAMRREAAFEDTVRKTEEQRLYALLQEIECYRGSGINKEGRH